MNDDTFEGGDGSVMVDLTDIQEASFEAIPIGVYEAVIKDCEFKFAKNSGAPMWSLQCQITEGKYDKRVIFDNMVFSEKALPFTKKSLSVIAPELLEGPFDPADNAGEMQGRTIRMRVGIRTWEGEKQNNVKAYLPLAEADAFLNG